MPYTNVTLNQFRSGILRRLGDLNATFWSNNEIRDLINEALSTWQFFSGYWQDKGHFVTTPGVGWYELPLVLQHSSGPLLLSYNATDREMLVDLERALLEPETTNWAAPWGGSEQFSFEILTRQLQQTKDLFLKDSGLIITRLPKEVVTQGVDFFLLPQDYLEIVRASWISFPNVSDPSVLQYDPMRASDYVSLQSFSDPITPGKPFAYEEYLSADPGIYIYPPSNDIGALEILYLGSGATLSPTTVETTLRIPYDLRWMLKYGAMDALLRADGTNRDPFRADYCKSRYDDALLLARNATSLLSAQVDNYPMRIAGVHGADSWNPLWRDDVGYPRTILTAGWNLIYVAPLPGVTTEVTDGKYDIEIFVNKNAPKLVNDADTIDLAPSLLIMIEDFVCHLALFKTSGAEFSKTFSAYETLLTAAMDYNSYLKTQARDLSIMRRRATETQTSVYMRREDDEESDIAMKVLAGQQRGGQR